MMAERINRIDPLGGVRCQFCDRPMFVLPDSQEPDHKLDGIAIRCQKCRVRNVLRFEKK